jgi:AcrR family transcriptional regulator
MAYPTKTDRAAILAVAMEQVEREGVERLAIRSVASALGLAPNALYRYFGSLAVLEAALAEEVRLQMLEVMQKAAARKAPVEAIRSVTKSYLRFAHKRPQAFALFLKTLGDPADSSPQCIRNTQFFLEQVSRVFPEDRVPDAAQVLWAFVHGLAQLREAKVLSKSQLSASLRFGLQMWIRASARQRSN